MGNHKNIKKKIKKEKAEIENTPLPETPKHVSDVKVVVDEESFPTVESKLADRIQKKKGKNSQSFQALELSQPTMRGILKMGYQFPTPIQRQSIPIILSGKDVVAMARTGSGKTAAFLIPMFEKLKEHSQKVGVRALIIAPTRELSMQIQKFIHKMGAFTDLRVCSILGGDSVTSQFNNLANNPDIIVATPGRLIHIIDQTGLSLQSVEYVVFDEADRLFEMGLSEQIHEICSKLPKNRQTVLFSATMPRMLVDFTKAGLRDPEIVRLDADVKISDQLQMSFYTVRSPEKDGALLYIVRKILKPEQQTIIFAATRHHVEYLHALFEKLDIECGMIYGSMDPTARKINIARFAKRDLMLLIVTDVAARGLDIPLLDVVINYDFPSKPKLFVHRVGRVARAGRSGIAYSLVTPDEIPYMLDLHLFIGRRCLNKKEDGSLPTDGYYGKFPQSLLDTEVEEVNRIIENDAFIKALKETCEKAYKMYRKTRASATGASIKRSRDLPNEIHPFIDEQIAQKEKERQDIVNQIKQYKPKVTVFELNQGTKEAQVMLKRRSEQDESKQVLETKYEREEKEEPKTLAQALLNPDRKRKRMIIENQLNKKPKVEKSYKDEEFYISGEKPITDSVDDQFLSLERSQFDIGAEDIEGMQKQRYIYRWDNKKKKYIKEFIQFGKPLKKSNLVRNEAGVLVEKDTTQKLYKKWQQQTKRRIQNVGEIEENTYEDINLKLKDLPTEDGALGKKGKKQKNELKTKEQVQKQRKLKKKRKLTEKIREQMKQFGAKKVKQALAMKGMIAARERMSKVIHKNAKSRMIVIENKKKKK